MVNSKNPKSREGVAVRDDRRLALIFMVVGVVAVVVFFVLQKHFEAVIGVAGVANLARICPIARGPRRSAFGPGRASSPLGDSDPGILTAPVDTPPVG